MTALAALFLLTASIAPKIMGAPVALQILEELGWPGWYLLPIGLLELVCVILFLLPRTGLWGAVLTTALLGGAIAAHLRVGSPLLSHTLFGVYLGGFMWTALVLRDRELRTYLIGHRSRAAARRSHSAQLN